MVDSYLPQKLALIHLMVSEKMRFTDGRTPDAAELKSKKKIFFKNSKKFQVYGPGEATIKI